MTGQLYSDELVHELRAARVSALVAARRRPVPGLAAQFGSWRPPRGKAGGFRTRLRLRARLGASVPQRYQQAG